MTGIRVDHLIYSKEPRSRGDFDVVHATLPAADTARIGHSLHAALAGSPGWREDAEQRGFFTFEAFAVYAFHEPRVGIDGYGRPFPRTHYLLVRHNDLVGPAVPLMLDLLPRHSHIGDSGTPLVLNPMLFEEDARVHFVTAVARGTESGFAGLIARLLRGEHVTWRTLAPIDGLCAISMLWPFTSARIRSGLSWFSGVAGAKAKSFAIACTPGNEGIVGDEAVGDGRAYGAFVLEQLGSAMQFRGWAQVAADAEVAGGDSARGRELAVSLDRLAARLQPPPADLGVEAMSHIDESPREASYSGLVEESFPIEKSLPGLILVSGWSTDPDIVFRYCTLPPDAVQVRSLIAELGKMRRAPNRWLELLEALSGTDMQHIVTSALAVLREDDGSEFLDAALPIFFSEEDAWKIRALATGSVEPQPAETELRNCDALVGQVVAATMTGEPTLIEDAVGVYIDSVQPNDVGEALCDLLTKDSIATPHRAALLTELTRQGRNGRRLRAVAFNFLFQTGSRVTLAAASRLMIAEIRDIENGTGCMDQAILFHRLAGYALSAAQYRSEVENQAPDEKLITCGLHTLATMNEP